MYKVVRAVALAVFVSSVSVAAVAQNVPIQPLWTANYNYSEGEARFSRDGSTLIASGRYGLVFFRTSDWRTIGTRPGANTMFVPTDDGKSMFAPQEGLNKVDLATGARSFVTPYELLYYLSISRDGSKLGWFNAETGKAAVTLFDLATSTRRLVKLPSLDDIRGIEFLPDNNSFVTSGPNLFRYDGTRPYKKTNYAKGFAVSADGQFAYQLTPSLQLSKFNVADGKQVWIKSVPDQVGEFVGLTSDGKGVVLGTVMADNRLGLAVHSTANGARIGEATKTEAVPKAISPIANQVVLSHSAAERYLKVVSVDTTTGAVTPVLNLSEAGAGTSSRRLPLNIGTGATAIPVVADIGMHWFKVFVRNSADGNLLKTIPLQANGVFGMAPDGSSYAVFINDEGADTGVVKLYRYSDDKEIASYRSSVKITAIDYATPTRLLLTNPASYLVMDVPGAKLVRARSFLTSAYSTGKISQDGTRFAGKSATAAEIRVLDATSGALVSKVDLAAEASQGYSSNIFFTGTGKLAVEGSWMAGSDVYYQTRVYDVAALPAVQVGKSQITTQYTYRPGDVSPNGKYIAKVFSNVHGYETIKIVLYVASTGKVYKELTVPFSQVGMLAKVRFSSNGLYLHVQSGDELGTTLFTVKV